MKKFNLVSIMLAANVAACDGNETPGPTVFVSVPNITFPAPPGINVAVNVTTASTATTTPSEPEPAAEEPEMVGEPTLTLTEGDFHALRTRPMEAVCGEIIIETPIKFGMTALNLEVTNEGTGVSARAFNTVSLVTEGGSRYMTDVTTEGLILFGRAGRIPLEIGTHRLTLFCWINTITEQARYAIRVASASGYNMENGQVMTMNTSLTRSVFTVEISATARIVQAPNGYATHTIPNEQGTRGEIGRVALLFSEDLYLTETHGWISPSVSYPTYWIRRAELRTGDNSGMIAQVFGTMDMWFHSTYYVPGGQEVEISIHLETNSRGLQGACYGLSFDNTFEARTREGYRVPVTFSGNSWSMFCDQD